MTANVHRRRDKKLIGRYRVFLDGRDITNDCFRLDTRLGKAWIYLRDDTGHMFVDPTTYDAATALIRGRVRVRRVRRKPVDTGDTSAVLSVAGV